MSKCLIVNKAFAVVSEREARLKLAEAVAAKEQAGVEEMESGLHATVMIANVAWNPANARPWMSVVMLPVA